MLLTPLHDVSEPDLEHLLAVMSVRELPPIPSTPAPLGHAVGRGSSTEPLSVLPPDISFLQGYDGREGRPLATSLPPRLRSSVLERLTSAQSSLPAPFTYVVLDAWRSSDFQKSLATHFGAENVAAGFVSDPDDRELDAPHVTGGAVDLTLAYGGTALAIGTDFDEFAPASGVGFFDEADGEADQTDSLVICSRLLRRLMYWSLVRAGFAPYASEWWHYSYGDQHWAAHYQRGQATYGPIAP